MVKLVVTETTTTTNSGTDSEAEGGESAIRGASEPAGRSELPDTAIPKRGGINRGLGLLVIGLVAKANELRALQNKMPIEEAYEKAKEEMPPGSLADRSIHIDFSNSIPETYIDNIISLESEWWGVTLTKESYAESGTWGAQWVFVVDGTDWRTFMKNLDAARGVKLEGSERGYHVGEPYPYEEVDKEGKKKETTYRGYSYINWRECINTAQTALYFKEQENKRYLIDYRNTKSRYWAFLKNDEIYRAVWSTEGDFWQKAWEKIAAWIINHELCHGIYRTSDENLLVFDGSVHPLEILGYYTVGGANYLDKTLADSETKDPAKWFDFTGGRPFKREEKKE